MRLTNEFTKFRKELWLLQVLAILYLATFTSDWYVENILGYVTRFFRHSKDAEKKTVSFIKKAYLKLVIFYLDF